MDPICSAWYSQSYIKPGIYAGILYSDIHMLSRNRLLLRATNLEADSPVTEYDFFAMGQTACITGQTFLWGKRLMMIMCGHVCIKLFMS